MWSWVKRQTVTVSCPKKASIGVMGGCWGWMIGSEAMLDGNENCINPIKVADGCFECQEAVACNLATAIDVVQGGPIVVC